MKTTTSIRTRIAAAVLATGAAAAITGGVVGTGTASAAAPEQGDYALVLKAHLPAGTGMDLLGIPVGALPASIHGDTLTIAGQSGKLTPFHGGRLDADGERAVIAGVPVVVWSPEPGDSVLDVDIDGVANAANLRR